jgi:uncharacterized protein (TIRG00374 family)
MRERPSELCSFRKNLCVVSDHSRDYGSLDSDRSTCCRDYTFFAHRAGRSDRGRHGPQNQRVAIALMKSHRRKVATIARVGAAAALVGGLLLHAGPEVILDTVAAADLALLGAALAVMLAYSIVKVWNWLLLLHGVGIRRPQQFRGVLICYMTGGLLGSVIPSSAGTDAVRALLTHRRFGGELTAHAASVVVLNAISLLAACILGLVAVCLMLGDGFQRLEIIAAILFSGSIATIVGLHMLLQHRRDWWLRLLRRLPAPLRGIRRTLRRFAGHLLIFERAHVGFAPVLANALFAQLLFAMTLLLTGLSVGIALDFRYWPIFGPLVSTIALIPASVSGFGVDQVGYVYLMGMVGVPEAQAFVASALLSVLAICLNWGVGGVVLALFPLRGTEQRSPSAAPGGAS